MLTWRCDHEPEFPRCVMLARKYLDDRHGTRNINSSCKTEFEKIEFFKTNSIFIINRI